MTALGAIHQFIFNQARAHKGRQWAHDWFLKCLSFCTYVSKALEAKSSLYTRNEGYKEPVLNLYSGELQFKADF